jgi:hypothetical protein
MMIWVIEWLLRVFNCFLADSQAPTSSLHIPLHSKGTPEARDWDIFKQQMHACVVCWSTSYKVLKPHLKIPRFGFQEVLFYRLIKYGITA